MKAFSHLTGLKMLDCADSIPKSETPKTQLSGDLQVLCPKITGISAVPVPDISLSYLAIFAPEAVKSLVGCATSTFTIPLATANILSVYFAR
jgi:hypothetical protein